MSNEFNLKQDEENLKHDQDARTDIVNDVKSNFFVEAGAGSGKTTMLVRRMVAMIESGIKISEICAITFTKAAAAEFYDRFRRLLVERSSATGKASGNAPGDLPPSTPETQEYCKEALKDFDLCFMGTIDSFCYKILSEHPFKSGVPSHSTVIPDKEAADYYRQQFVKIANGAYDSVKPGLSRLANHFQTLHDNPEEAFAKGAEFLMCRRNVKFDPEDEKSFDDAEYLKEKERLLWVLDFLREPKHREKLENVGKEKQDSQAAWNRLNAITAHIRNGSPVSEVLNDLKQLKKLNVPRAAANEMNPCEKNDPILVPQKNKSENTSIMELNPAILDPVIEKTEELRYDGSMKFLLACLPVLAEKMKRDGIVTYFDCLYYLREMLHEDAEKDSQLIKYIQNTYKYFLIDEFQDTNPMQAEVFFYLAADEPKTPWTQCVPRPGALFIVGDPKQSIYRFRDADVESFGRVQALFTPGVGRQLTLCQNFRSTVALRDYFNKVFPSPSLLPQQFTKIPTTLPKDSAGKGLEPVYTFSAYPDQDKNADSEEANAARIAAIIQALVNHDSYQIRDVPDGKLRTISYRDIMVLTYRKGPLAPILRKLNKLKIPVKVEGSVPFDKNEALAEVCHLFAAVADPADKIALYGALTGKVMGLTDSEILSFRKNHGDLSLRSSFDKKSCRDSAALRVAAKLEELKALCSAVRGLSPAALFSKLVDDFRIDTLVEAAHLDVLYYALELLRAAEQDGTVTGLREGKDFLADLRAQKTDIERCLSLKESEDRVHLANLHKVKGLEAPIVILAAANEDEPKLNYRIVHDNDTSNGYLFKLPIPGLNNAAYFQASAERFKQEKKNEEASIKAENSRLLYVAATRAKDALIICKSADQTKSFSWDSLSQDPLLPDFFTEIVEKSSPESGTPAAAPTPPHAQTKKECVLQDTESLGCSYTVMNPSRLPLLSKTEAMDELLFDPAPPAPEEPDEPAAKGGPEAVRESRRRLGTMVHKLMEMLVSSRNQCNPSDAVKQIISEYMADDEPQKQEVAAKLEGIANQLIEGGGYSPQKDDVPQDILSALRKAEKVYCELPFRFREKIDGKPVLWHGIIDLIYFAEGKWHIIDYKTNRNATGLKEIYQKQLEAYARAFRKKTDAPVDTAIYHIDIS